MIYYTKYKYIDDSHMYHTNLLDIILDKLKNKNKI